MASASGMGLHAARERLPETFPLARRTPGGPTHRRAPRSYSQRLPRSQMYIINPVPPITPTDTQKPHTVSVPG